MRLLLTVLYIAISTTLLAQEITTDRPDQTESAAVVGPKAFQFESGFLVQQNGNLNQEILLPTNLFRIGLSKKLELRVVHEYQISKVQLSDNTLAGFNDLQLGFKWQLFESNDASTQLAVISHAVLPTGTGLGFSLDNYGVINKLSFGQDLSNDWSIGINLNYDYLESHSLGYTLAVGYGITSQLGVYFETFGNKTEDQDFENYYDAGLTYLLRENIQLDFSFGSGLNTDMNYLSVGLSWLFVNADEN